VTVPAGAVITGGSSFRASPRILNTQLHHAALAFRKNYIVPLPDGSALSLGERTLVMAVLNVTPDSFAGEALSGDPEQAVARGLEMVADGADIIDVGGESTRPGAAPVGDEEELRRVLPIIRGLARQVAVPISIDTTKSRVAAEALAAGATIVNDISGLRYDSAVGAAAADAGAPLVLMHMRGRSSDMYRWAEYSSVVGEVVAELGESIDAAVAQGVSRERIIIDPGLGFAKKAEQTYRVLAGLSALTALDRPILVGPSRKSFLKKTLGDVEPDGREWGTAAAVTAAILLGAHIVRVHGVREMVQVSRVADEVRGHADPASDGRGE
jgi:dihydropteroate synthase